MQLFFEAVTLGFSIGGVCAATCIPVFFPFSVSGDGKRRFLPVVLIFAGRLLACVTVGAVSGALGSAVSTNFLERFSSYAIILLAAFMLMRAAGAFGNVRFCGRVFTITEKIKSPLFAGFLMGINLCAPFIMAVVLAAEKQSAISGIVVFSGFFIGTSIFLLPLFIIPFLAGTALRPWLVKLAGVTAALLAIYLAAGAVQKINPPEKYEVIVTRGDVEELFPSAKNIELVKTRPRYFIASGVLLDETMGYAVLTTDWAPGVNGYNGRIPALTALDNTGRIREVRVLDNDETISYVSYIFSEEYLEKFKGKSYMDAFEIGKDVDAVSGATVSLAALAGSVGQTTRTFASCVLGRDIPGVSAGRRIFDLRNIVVILLFALGIAVLVGKVPVHLLGGINARTVMLVVSILVLGFHFRFFVTISDVVKIIFGLTGGTVEFPHRFVIMGLAAAGAVLFGRFYCSFICPYGALQEILYKISPFKGRVSPKLDWRLRITKYVVLFLVPVAYGLTHRFDVFNIEPFQVTFGSLTSFSFFSNMFGSCFVCVVFAIVVLSAALVMERFFCAYFCPLGALFAVLSIIKIFPRRLFVRKGAGCEDCVKGLPDLEEECFLCGGIPEHEPDGESSGKGGELDKDADNA